MRTSKKKRTRTTSTESRSGGSARARAHPAAAARPEITAAVVGSGVQIGWGWGGYGRHLDQCEIYVDRGSGWGALAQDSTPGYTDTTPHPATPTKWKYKAIYRVDDSQVGLWSAEVSVVVGG